MTQRQRHPYRAAKPTQRMLKAAFDAQAPIDSDAVMAAKKKHRKGDDELPPEFENPVDK